MNSDTVKILLDMSGNAGVVTITPDKAKILLDYTNTKSCLVNSRAVNYYAGLMKAGRWYENSDPVSITKTGILTNGFNRLLAIIKSGVDVDCLVCLDV